MTKGLKPMARTSANEALAAVEQVAPTLPPMRVAEEDRPTTLNMRMQTSSVSAITEAAQRQGLTIKQVVARALAESGMKIAEIDLEDRTPRRGVRRS